MKRTDSLARKIDRACVDRVEAAALSSDVGETFAAFVVEDGDHGHGKGEPTIQLVDHAVVATVKVGDAAAPALGEACEVTLTGADIATGKLTFALA